MNNECITVAAEDTYVAVACAESEPTSISIEALGRALGYTALELALAKDRLSQFAWRRPAESSRRKVKTIDCDPLFISPDRNRVA